MRCTVRPLPGASFTGWSTASRFMIVSAEEFCVFRMPALAEVDQ